MPKPACEMAGEFAGHERRACHSSPPAHSAGRRTADGGRPGQVSGAADASSAPSIWAVSL
ncbi:hypothetical protein SAMN04489712_102539 [Thermomonospora echinospora]|uniref:Uncharacterized protein n=1 Tax=Thermomonospora echinospora TaxID=1992 RepID=A0A1H5W012_9ACTN|nr:hypothetical protein SAMN04489712_102539 [Thermomonospora echinospora]